MTSNIARTNETLVFGSYPPYTVGVMGGGQLGKMLVHTAQRMGLETAVLDPDPLSPAGLIAHHHICTAFDDAAGLAKFAQLCDAVTTEFENVPAQALRQLALNTTVFPSADSVSICQDRSLEKDYFNRSGVPCAPYVELCNPQDCAAVDASLFPGILKTAKMGYDGKGQVTVDNPQDLLAAWHQLGAVRCVLEKKLDLAQEISVIVARNTQQDSVHLPVQTNIHKQGILSTTHVPSLDTPEPMLKKAIDAAHAIANTMDYVGVLCIEFFILKDGRLLANEMAPRPHNSGHYSLDACDIDQYELQLRAVVSAKLVQPTLMQPAVMLNLLGDIWFTQQQVVTPNFEPTLKTPGAKLHLYGKQEPKMGRKMGHITVTAHTLAEAHAKACACASSLGIKL